MSKRISLISNSSIQYHKFEVVNDGIEIFYRKQELLDLDFSVNNKLNDIINFHSRINAENSRKFKALEINRQTNKILN